MSFLAAFAACDILRGEPEVMDMGLRCASVAARAAAATIVRAVAGKVGGLRPVPGARTAWLFVFLIALSTPIDSEAQVGNRAVLAPVNSVVFAKRAPIVGMFTYPQSIRFIDDSLKYIDPYSQFLVSPVGEMCFRAWPTSVQPIYETYYKYWCVYPQFVGRVEPSPSGNAVVLWCKHAYPQCIHRDDPYLPMDYGSPVANHLVVQMVTSQQGRRVLEGLVYLMGGDLQISGVAGGFP